MATTIGTIHYYKNIIQQDAYALRGEYNKMRLSCVVLHLEFAIITASYVTSYGERGSNQTHLRGISSAQSLAQEGGVGMVELAQRVMHAGHQA
jgi:hypothetical protein